MKGRIDIYKQILYVFLSIIILIASLSLGAYKGWNKEQDSLVGIAMGSGNVAENLGYLGADASNILAVSKRHLPTSHEYLSVLNNIYQSLTRLSNMPEDIKYFDAFKVLLPTLKKELSESETFIANEQDNIYISTLFRDVETLMDEIIFSQYNATAKAHNLRINKSFSGKIALKLGIKEALVFE